MNLPASCQTFTVPSYEHVANNWPNFGSAQSAFQTAPLCAFQLHDNIHLPFSLSMFQTYMKQNNAVKYRRYTAIGVRDHPGKTIYLDMIIQRTRGRSFSTGVERNKRHYVVVSSVVNDGGAVHRSVFARITIIRQTLKH